MPLILAPSFDEMTREAVEAHLEQVRLRRLAGALEYQQSKALKLDREHNTATVKLANTYDKLGKALMRLDSELEKIEQYLALCQILRTEADLTMDRINLSKRK